jgi:Protein of unknown function (DUF1800)
MSASWSEKHVRRLYWRAGFGASPEEAARWAGQGKDATLRYMLSGGAALAGPPPRVDGGPLDPVNEWGHDVLWWLDRMVRSQRPLREKMTLFWHDHFATRDQETPLMLAQNRKLRRHALGRFPALLRTVTADPAMQLFLSLADSSKWAPNENFARELMELFTLGGGYGERDVREAARALTGFRVDWDRHPIRIYFDREWHDRGVKRILGKRGRFDWRDVLRITTSRKGHAPFIVDKLWSYFITVPLDGPTRKHLVRTYRRSGLRIKPVVEAILGHPALYADLDRPDMVKSPVVFLAGAIRSAGGGIQHDDWSWLLEMMGQYPFRPPTVAGWDWGPAWVSTNTVHARFKAITYLMHDDDSPLRVPEGSTPPNGPSHEAVARARAAVGHPWTSPETDAALERMASGFFADFKPRQTWGWQQRSDQREQALRHLLLSGPDAQLH